MHGSLKSAAVCRAEWRVEWSRCAVRMTVRGSVTPWMACGSRPVEGNPQLGDFPAVGIRPAAGLLKTAASVLNPPPPNGRLANRHCRQRAARTNRSPLSRSFEYIQTASVYQAESDQARPEVARGGRGMHGPAASGRGGARPQGQQPVPGRQKAGAPRPLKATIRRRPHQVGPS